MKLKKIAALCKRKVVTIEEAARAMVAGVPVIYKGITYEKISGLVCRRAEESGCMKVCAELQDMCGHSVTVARLDWVGWENEDDRARAGVGATLLFEALSFIGILIAVAWTYSKKKK